MSLIRRYIGLTLISFLLILAVFPIRSVIFTPEILEFGRNISYNIQYFYLLEFFVFLIVLKVAIKDWAYFKNRLIKIRKYFLLLALIYLSNLFLLSDINTFILNISFIRILELLFAWIAIDYIFKRKEDNNYYNLIFAGFIIFQLGLSIIQIIIQKNLGLNILGEPIFSVFHDGASKFTFLNSMYIRPMGTLAHPNILAFFFGLFATKYVFNKSFTFRLLAAFAVFGVLLTLSRSILISFVISIITYYIFCHIKKMKINLDYPLKITQAIVTFILILALFLPFLKSNFFNVLNNESISKRLSLIDSSIDMIIENPLGLGPNGFVMNLFEYSDTKLMPWDIQPVHNGILLIITEYGILSLFILLMLIISTMKYFKEEKHIYMLPIVLFVFLCSLFDHFLITYFPIQIITIVFILYYKNYFLIDKTEH